MAKLTVLQLKEGRDFLRESTREAEDEGLAEVAQVLRAATIKFQAEIDHRLRAARAGIAPIIDQIDAVLDGLRGRVGR